MTDLPAARKNIDLAYGALGEAKASLALISSAPESPVRSAESRIVGARKHLIAAKNALREPAPAPVPPPVPVPVPPPVPQPTPPDTFWDQHFAIVITAGNADPNVLWDAGVRAVAFDVMNEANRVEAQAASWARFERGVFLVTRGTTEATLKVEASAFSWQMAPPFVTFAVVDTENLKGDATANGFALQATFYAELRRIAPTARIANITYGWHQDGSVVNYKALSDNKIEPWFEAYNGDEASWQVRPVVEKLNLFGFKPVRICLGDKRLIVQVPIWKQLVAEGKAAKGAMLWAVDNGPAQEALRGGVKIA